MNIGELFVIFGLKPTGWGKANKLVRELRSAAHRYIGVEAVRHVVNFVEHITEAATHLISLSTAMGMTVEQTQEWEYVAKQSGSTLKELSIGVNMLIRNLDKFSRGQGGKELAFQFRRLGLSATDAKLALSGSDGLQQVMLKMSDHIRDLGDKSKSTEAVMTQLFGVRAGRAMLADMGRGSAAIKELFARRREMGEVTQDQATALRDLHNHLQDMKIAFSALAAQVIAQLAPRFIEMAEAARKWMASHRELISGALTAVLTVVAGLFKLIAGTVEMLGTAIRKALGGDVGAIALLAGIATVIGAVVIPALASMAVAAWASVGPYLLIGAAVGAAVYILIKWGQALVRVFVGVWHDHIKPTIDAITDGFWDAVHAVERFGRRIGTAVSDGVAKAKAELAAFFSWVSREARKIPLLGWLGDKIGHGIARLAGGGPGGTDVDRRDLDAIDSVMVANAPGAKTANVPASARNITNNINVNAPMKIDGAKNPAQTATKVADHLDNTLRHAMRGVGGER